MGDAESKIEFLQYPKGLLREPGFIPEFEGMPQAFRAGKSAKENAKFLQPLHLKFEPGGKLPEHNSQLLFQRGGVFQEEGEGFSAIFQPFDMSDVPASFDRKREFLGSPFMPSFKDLFLGKAVEGDIQFDGVKIFGIEFEPLSLRKIGGIEDPIPPMGIIVAACADQDHVSDCRLRIGGFKNYV